MKRLFIFPIIILFALFYTSCDQQPISSEVNIIPRPSNLFMANSYFKVNDKTKIVLQVDNDEMRMLGGYLASALRKISGLELPVILYDEAREVNGDIVLLLSGMGNRSEEAYQFEYRNSNYILESRTGKGLFYAIQSFLQLIPIEVLTAENIYKAYRVKAQVKKNPRTKHASLVFLP